MQVTLVWPVLQLKLLIVSPAAGGGGLALIGRSGIECIRARDREMRRGAENNKNSAILTEAKQLNVGRAAVMAVPSSGHRLALGSQTERRKSRTCEIKRGLPATVTY